MLVQKEPWKQGSFLYYSKNGLCMMHSDIDDILGEVVSKVNNGFISDEKFERLYKLIVGEQSMYTACDVLINVYREQLKHIDDMHFETVYDSDKREYYEGIKYIFTKYYDEHDFDQLIEVYEKYPVLTKFKRFETDIIAEITELVEHVSNRMYESTLKKVNDLKKLGLLE